MFRKKFLLGVLTGLVLGVALAYVNVSLSRKNGAVPSPAVVSPRWAPATFSSPAIERRSKPVPPNWQEFEFNGQPVYIIPLAQHQPALVR